MNSPKTAYIALGSNVGERFQLLQTAVNRLYEEVGTILEISDVYETPAWGFKGNSFLNACLAISTRFTAEEVLEKLLKIETQLGRSRSEIKNYQNRTLDLDILLMEDLIIDSESLVVPHPQMQNRNFVLRPLADIASKEIHPKLKISIAEMLKNTSDDSPLESITEKLQIPKRNYNFKNCNYIAVEGNIGAGKTTFATMVSQDFNAKLILERFKDNPFLPKFYKNEERYAFPLEMSFLADRYQQLSDDLAQFDLFKNFVISDYDVFKSLIFAKITLSKDEYLLYYKFFQLIYKDLVKPDLYIYLHQKTNRLLENIKNRGRDYEQNIQPEYLSRINKSYSEFLKYPTQMKVQIIDISEKNFVNNRSDYLKILEEIDSSFSQPAREN